MSHVTFRPPLHLAGGSLGHLLLIFDHLSTLIVTQCQMAHHLISYNLVTSKTCFTIRHLPRLNIRGGSKVWFFGQGGACYSASNGQNDLKFCMLGAFVGYYWVLVKSRLYSIVTHKSPLYAKFQVIWSTSGRVILIKTSLQAKCMWSQKVLMQFSRSI